MSNGVLPVGDPALITYIIVARLNVGLEIDTEGLGIVGYSIDSSAIDTFTPINTGGSEHP